MRCIVHRLLVAFTSPAALTRAIYTCYVRILYNMAPLGSELVLAQVAPLARWVAARLLGGLGPLELERALHAVSNLLDADIKVRVLVVVPLVLDLVVGRAVGREDTTGRLPCEFQVGLSLKNTR